MDRKSAGHRYTGATVYFEPMLCPEGLRDADLRTLHAFGVRGCLACLASEPRPGSARAWLEHLEALLSKQLQRLEGAGLEASACVGAPPELADDPHLEVLVDALPLLLARGPVRAVGPVSLRRGTPSEHALLRRLATFAATYRLPLVASLAQGTGASGSRALLRALARAPVPPDRVLVVGASPALVEAALALGFRAGLLVGEGSRAVARAVELVARRGPEHLALVSRAGSAGADLLALPLAAHLLAGRGLRPGVRRRVTGANARSLLGLPRAR